MSEFQIYIKKDSDKIQVDIPEIFKDPDSETYTDQIKTYLCSVYGCDYYNISLDVKREKRMMKNVKDIEVLNDDEIYVIFKEEPKQDLSLISNIKSGFSDVNEKDFSDINTNVVLEYQKCIEKEYTTKLDIVKSAIKSCFTEDKEDKEFLSLSDSLKGNIKMLYANNYGEFFHSVFPFRYFNRCLYFCRFVDGKPLGLGFMYDEIRGIYYEGYFNSDVNITNGKCLVTKNKRSFSICKTFNNLMKYDHGKITYLDSDETYNGCFFMDLYSGYGVLNKDSISYTGNFVDNMKNGYGFILYPNLDRYYGFWSNDKKNVFGKTFYNTGDFHIGVYEEDSASEFGVYYSLTDNISYLGTFFNNKRSFNKDEYKIIQGCVLYSDLIGIYDVSIKKYELTYKKKSFHSVYVTDKQYYTEASNYEIDNINKNKSKCYYGSFNQNCEIFGCGRFFSDNNDEITDNDVSDLEPYSIEYLKKKYKNYVEYQGLFHSRSQNGFGYIKYPNGDYYIGDIKFGLRDGNGTLNKNNGEIYKAFWVGGYIKYNNYV